MSRPDVTDKDPFANTADVPRDNVSALGFLTRAIIKFGLYRIIWMAKDKLQEIENYHFGWLYKTKCKR